MGLPRFVRLMLVCAASWCVLVGCHHDDRREIKPDPKTEPSPRPTFAAPPVSSPPREPEAPRDLFRRHIEMIEGCNYFALCMSTPSYVVQPAKAPYAACEARYRSAVFSEDWTARVRTESKGAPSCCYLAHECKFPI